MSELSPPRYCEEEDAGNQAPAAAAILQRAPLPAIIFQEDNCVTTNIGPTPIHHHIGKLSVHRVKESLDRRIGCQFANFSF